MNKQYTLIVQDRISLSNETDAHPQSDYSPGIWSIKTQKSAMKWAKQLLAEGDKITRVTTYDNPNYAALANSFIKELGLDHPLFQEPVALKQELVTNGKPATLGALKKFLQPNLKLYITNYDSDGVTIKAERETFIRKVQSNSFTVDRQGKDSWFYFDKAINWKFSNTGATHYWIGSDGKFTPSSKLTYITQ